MPTGGRAIHAYLSEEGHEAWETLANDNGVSMTGLLEAIALQILEQIEANDMDAEGLFPDWVKGARKVDAIRRHRGPHAQKKKRPLR